MNRPDDDIERSLHRYFKNFDAEYDADAPSAKAWENIQKNIQPKTANTNRGKKALAIVLILLCLMVIGDVFNNSFVGKSLDKENLSKGLNTKNGLADIHKKEAEQNKTFESSAKRETKLIVFEGIKEVIKSIERKATKSDIISLNRNAKTINRLNERHRKLTKNNKFVTTFIEKRLRNYSVNKIEKESSATTFDNLNIDEQNQQKYREPQMPHLSSISAKGFLPFGQNLATAIVKVPESVPELPLPKSSQTSWTVSVQPFQTFQYLTNNVSTTDFQLASLYVPSWASTIRTGWQVRLGAEGNKSRRLAWRASGFYRSMPKFVSYRVSTNQFLIKEITANQVNVERITIDVEEQTTIHLVGLQADYVYRLKHGFFVSSGIEGSFDWNNSQSKQLGASASVGWEKKLTEKRSLVVEPTYTYFFHKTTDLKQVLQLQPYTVGLKLGLKFAK